MRTDLAWLLEADVALRWQVERDLAGAPAPVWEATRARTATEGMAARLLALQDADGQWAGGAFFPNRTDPRITGDANQGQPWTATTWSLNSLREWGLPASALRDTAGRLAASCRWEYDDLPYWGGEVDVCINGFTLANGAWLGVDVSPIATWFLEHEMAEGGWNCEWENGSSRASVRSTLNGLRGILCWERITGSAALREVRHRAQEYLLARRLMYRLTTGERLGPWVEDFAYPFRAGYSVLSALDYFQEASMHDGVAPDPRLAEAIEVVRSARDPHGRWRATRRYPGQVWFDVDVPVGEPSPWLTFLATRVLQWWDDANRS